MQLNHHANLGMSTDIYMTHSSGETKNTSACWDFLDPNPNHHFSDIATRCDMRSPFHQIDTDNWLVVYLPLWKIWVRQLGWWHSQLNGTNHVPNHQPERDSGCGFRSSPIYVYIYIQRSPELVSNRGVFAATAPKQLSWFLGSHDGSRTKIVIINPILLVKTDAIFFWKTFLANQPNTLQKMTNYLLVNVNIPIDTKRLKD